ncbi:ABC transporter ATP-binding protein [Streptomyces sp. BK340]|uniref:ATP-binding cassette domain-containing protein n=1 Tax=Streptomyces sp. BK340 TaxID=2572903 RepID=UPI001645E050|nr:ABC transporter ATP-binding protein [Streptomyces sp. BK340]
MTVQLALIGLCQAICVVAFSVVLHVVADRARHPSGGLRMTGIYRPFAHWPSAALLTALAVAAAAAVGLKAVAPPLAERLAQSYVHSVRLALFDQISHSEAWGSNRRTVGVTVLRFTGDSTALRQWVSRGVATLLADGVFVLCTLAVLAVFSPVAGTATAVLVLLCGAAAALVGRRLRDKVKETRRHNGRLAAFVNERATHFAVMQSLGRGARDRRVLSRRSQKFSDAVVAQARLNGALEAVAEAARTGSGLVVIGAGVAAGARPDALLSLMPVAGFLGPPLSSLVRVQEYWQLSQVARRRIAEVISTPARLCKPAAPEPLLDGPGQLELVHVRISGLLGGTSVVVPPGQRVCLQGDAAVGKSLLLAVLARLHVPDGGTVLLDGQDIARCDPNELRQAVRLVSPELPLLRGSVEMNLRHGEGTARQQDMPDEAATFTELRRWQDEALAALLPQGLRTKVGEGGQGLSMAARNQVALARALRSRPRVLLLDAVESKTTVGGEALDRVLAWYPGTVIYVSQDRCFAERADSIWHIADRVLTVRHQKANQPGRTRLHNG